MAAELTPPDLASLRVHYDLAELADADAPPEPWPLVTQWLQEALASEAPEPSAMSLATADADGTPHVRVVLLKEADSRGFVFYTNYHSHKGSQLQDNAKAALAMWWAPLQRQLRVEGRAERTTPEETAAYFSVRPRDSQLGAWTSPQSQTIASREVLQDRWAEVSQRFAGVQDIPPPPHWGGYRVVPTRIEFWQGRPSRLHDRLLYELQADGSWTRARLAP